MFNLLSIILCLGTNEFTVLIPVLVSVNYSIQQVITDVNE